MKAIINITPAEFSAHFITVKYPNTPLYKQEHEAKNAAQLEAIILNIKDCIFKDSLINIRPITRKFAGFDKWEKANKPLLEIRTD